MSNRSPSRTEQKPAPEIPYHVTRAQTIYRLTAARNALADAAKVIAILNQAIAAATDDEADRAADLAQQASRAVYEMSTATRQASIIAGVLKLKASPDPLKGSK